MLNKKSINKLNLHNFYYIIAMIFQIVIELLILDLMFYYICFSLKIEATRDKNNNNVR